MRRELQERMIFGRVSFCDVPSIIVTHDLRDVACFEADYVIGRGAIANSNEIEPKVQLPEPN